MTAASTATCTAAPSVDTVVDPDRAEVTAIVTGRVDYTTVDLVRRPLLGLAGGPARRLIVDLTDADLADPTVAAALVRVEAEAAHHSVRFSVVVAPGSHTEETLSRCGLVRSMSAAERRAGLPGHW